MGKNFLIFILIFYPKAYCKSSVNFKLQKYSSYNYEINYFQNKNYYEKSLKMEREIYPKFNPKEDPTQSSSSAPIIEGHSPLESIQRACGNVGDSHAICGGFNSLKNNLEKIGNDIVKSIPYPTATAVSTFMIKTISEQKVSLDIHDKTFFNPKIEISPNKANLNFNYNW